MKSHQISDHLHVVTMQQPCCAEHFLAAPTVRDVDMKTLMADIETYLRQNDAKIASQEVFCSNGDEASLTRRFEEKLGPLNWPLTCTDWQREGLIGIQLWAVSKVKIDPITLNGYTIGSVFEDDCARYCRLGGLRSTDISKDRDTQAYELFQLIEKTLVEAGFSLKDILRTWFYMDDILTWYGDFNKVRNDFFLKKGIFKGLVPASTGIGSGNASGSAVVGGLIAVRPKCGDVQARTVDSPLQCSAGDYGSSFSRAVELALPCYRRLFVSGTASIAPEGHTIHVGDVDAQIVKTMDVVDAILCSRKMDWRNVVHGIVYIRNPQDMVRYEQYCRDYCLPPMPVVISNSTVCRDDLLFEIEVDALSANPMITESDTPLSSCARKTECSDKSTRD